MEQIVVVLIYSAGIVGWLLFWACYIRLESLRENPLLFIPFLLCLVFLGLNLCISGSNTGVGDSKLEESLFHFLDARSGLVISATASVLVVVTIIYGASSRRFPLKFIQFEAFSFMVLLGIMAPVVWIPQGDPKPLMLLRHCQTVAFLWGVFLCVSGIMILLNDLMEMRRDYGDYEFSGDGIRVDGFIRKPFGRPEASSE